MSVVTRFAPSPTGLLHVGNARTALFNWLFARTKGGVMLLRLDDTDVERSTPAFAAAIERDLAWLGLDWSRRVRQSERHAVYAAARERLAAAGRLYPCYETGEELEARRDAQLRRGKPPLYDRAALALDAAARARLEAEGRRPHWRFLLDHRAVVWDDLIHGPARFEGGHLSDPVLFRADGAPTYTLASVADDLDLGITHVIRGDDHVTNTAIQIQLFEALGGTPPQFAHHGLLTGADGKGLSKRLGSLSLESLRADGFEAMTVVSLLARLGTADPVEPGATLDEVAAEFDIGRVGRGPARFTVTDLEALNPRVLQILPFAAVRERLAALSGEADETFWHAVRANLARLDEAAEWWRVCRGPLAPQIVDPELVAAAAAQFPEGAVDANTWTAWTARLRESTDRKGRALFRPLRLALTAREHGPEMQSLLPLIGRDRAIARLRGETA